MAWEGVNFLKLRMCQYPTLFCYISRSQKTYLGACRHSLHNSGPSCTLTGSMHYPPPVEKKSRVLCWTCVRLLKLYVIAALSPSSSSVALTRPITVPTSTSSRTSNVYWRSSNRGAWSLASITMTTVSMVADRRGLPPSLATTVSWYSGTCSDNGQIATLYVRPVVANNSLSLKG